MVLFWKSGPFGRLWIDESALKDLVKAVLPEGMGCISVQLVGDRDLLNVYISFPPGQGEPDAESLRTLLSERFSPLGLNPSVSLVSGEEGKSDRKSRHPLLFSPLFWGLAASFFVAVLNLGLSGVFWVLLFGFSAYGLTWLFLTPGGRDRLASFLDRFEE